MSQLAIDRRPNTAVISACGVYRYELRRELGGERPLVVLGLNPSTATAETDDNTIRKDVGFAQRWGCGLLVKGNAYGYRATDPKDMKRAKKSGVNIVGPENDLYLRDMIALAKHRGGILLVAWGNHICPGRQAEISYLIDGFDIAPMCLKTNANGTPVHELYQPYDRALVPWSCP